MDERKQVKYYVMQDGEILRLEKQGDHWFYQSGYRSRLDWDLPKYGYSNYWEAWKELCLRNQNTK